MVIEFLNQIDFLHMYFDVALFLCGLFSMGIKTYAAIKK